MGFGFYFIANPFIVVDENLRLVEAQLNSFKAKKSTIMDSGALSSDPQVRNISLSKKTNREY
jgi:hypothetical protein